ncbi:MAG: thiol oxidoreductase [Chloroflexi bacterium]|nr:thiol oxidoreductase [Chloroflexota bacterium]
MIRCELPDADDRPLRYGAYIDRDELVPTHMRVFLLLASTLIAIAGLGCESNSTSGQIDPDQFIGDAPAVPVHISQSDIDDGKFSIPELIEHGELLFTAVFNTLDGAGRPESTGAGDSRIRRVFPENRNRISGPDSDSCTGCHNMPSAGGGGDNVANVFVRAQERDFLKFDGGDGDGESGLTLQSAGNERNTLGMFGSGYIELLAREMTEDLHSIRDEALLRARSGRTSITIDLVTKGVSFGSLIVDPDGTLGTDAVEGIDEDLIVKPFHQKGAVISLRQFTNNALNHHHGIQSEERFGADADPDNDGVVDELTVGDLTALTVFQATLPMPKFLPSTGPKAREALEQGQELFGTIGCSTCHMTELPLRSTVFTEPNPYNPEANLRQGDVKTLLEFDLRRYSGYLKHNEAGEFLVPAFTDLKRHDMGPDLDNEVLEQAGIPTNEWLTRKLWGAASEPPFLHHGRASLISEAILLHGGEAQASRDLFANLSDSEKAGIVEYLKSLQIESDG